MIQGTEEWKQERCGKITASRIGDLMARTKNGYGASRKNLIAEKVCEILTGCPADSYCSPAMQWGIEQEPNARLAYEFETGADVVLEGFVLHPEIVMAGASPDGLVGENGLIEIKCFTTANHIETLLNGGADKKYIYQMQFQMACCEREFCDFVSYDPRLPRELELFIKRVERDDSLITEIEKEVGTAISEINETVEKLRRLNAKR